jgi:exodeoxyribonuclease V beta subunit
MKSYNVLDPTSPLYGKIFIEASAGTGKTFAIEHMVLRLILDGMCITEILVVTFTKAGAGDLKTRIHTSLLNTLEMIQTGDKTIPYLNTIESKQEATLLLENACALSSEMPVCTIHSFAFGALGSFAFEGGVDFDLLHFEDERSKDVTLTAILDTMRSETTEENISAAQCTKMMDFFERKLASFTRKVASIIANEKNLELPPSYKKLQEDFLRQLEDIPFEGLYEEFLSIAPAYKRTTNRQKEIHPHLIDQVKLLTEKDLDALILSSPSIIELLQEENLKKNKTVPENFILPKLLKTLYPIFTTAKNPETPITHIAIKAKKRLDEMDIKSPDAILLSMLEALSKPLFKENIQSLYSACIIDEFQDTDPIQWEILSSLFFSETKLFCTVGDPKQSIYAFRGADLPTYLKAKRSFTTHLSLDTNFRSNEKIIDTLNNLFSEENAPSFLSFTEPSDDLKYVKVQVGKKSIEASSIELLLCPPPKKKTVRSSLKEAESLYFLPHICNKIKSLAMDLDNIAILVKDRYQGLAVSLFLKQMNIPVKANISASLLESSLFSLFETLLFLTLNPRSESLIKKLLTHPIINAPIDLLKEDLKNPLLQKLSIDFTLLNNTLETRGIHAYLQALIDTPLFDESSLGQLICTNEENYLTMMQIFSLFLSNFEKDPKHFISEIQKLNPDVFTFLKKGTGTDKKSVTIMTSHLSKGLEFEAVFALSLYTRMKQAPQNEQEAILIDKEKMRLLYVTLTRAKSHLFIYGTLFGAAFPLEKGNGSPLELFLSRINSPFLNYDQLYQRAASIGFEHITENGHIPVTILRIGTSIPLKKSEEIKTILPPESALSFKKSLTPRSFSSLPFEKNDYVPVVNEAEFPYGSKVGNQIHLIFEKIVEEGLYHPFIKERIYPVVEKSFFQTVLSGFEAVVYEKIKEIFTCPLTSKYSTFTLESIQPDHMYPEVLFHYKLANSSGEMKGFADLIAFYQGRYYIIDWKCNHLEEYTQDHLKKTLEENNYTKQASIYTRALQSFLEAKNLPFEEYAGGAFYIFVRAGKEGNVYFTPEAMKDEEILCLK